MFFVHMNRIRPSVEVIRWPRRGRWTPSMTPTVSAPIRQAFHHENPPVTAPAIQQIVHLRPPAHTGPLAARGR